MKIRLLCSLDSKIYLIFPSLIIIKKNKDFPRVVRIFIPIYFLFNNFLALYHSAAFKVFPFFFQCQVSIQTTTRFFFHLQKIFALRRMWMISIEVVTQKISINEWRSSVSINQCICTHFWRCFFYLMFATSSTHSDILVLFWD